MEQRKRELKEQYKQLKPQMGVLALRNLRSNRIFIEVSKDIKSMFNRIQFQLEMGMHPNKQLQQDWKENRAEGFAFETIDLLDYSKDESKTDYQEDLKTLKTIWLEKLHKNPEQLFY